MHRLLSIVILLAVSGAVAAAIPIKPKVRSVTLAEFTQITVPIVPDLGTRLVFPFVLDADSQYVPFTLNATNAAFQVPEPQPGRNAIVVTLPSDNYSAAQAMLGSVYITVGGYQVTLLLRSTTDVREYVSDINFVLGDKARQDLIETAVERRIEGMKREYEKKERLLGEQAHDMALHRLGSLILREPERGNVYEDNSLDYGTGEVGLKVTRYVETGPFRAYRLNISYHTAGTTPLPLTGAKLFGRNSQGRSLPVDAVTELPATIKPGQTVNAVLVTDSADIATYDGYEIILGTAEGEVSVAW